MNLFTRIQLHHHIYILFPAIIVSCVMQCLGWEMRADSVTLGMAMQNIWSGLNCERCWSSRINSIFEDDKYWTETQDHSFVNDGLLGILQRRKSSVPMLCIDNCGEIEMIFCLWWGRGVPWYVYLVSFEFYINWMRLCSKLYFC